MGQKITSSDSRRLASNTLMLYLRTLLVMGISLFTSRVILATLGIDNYGTYNVIGGFVSMFSLAGGTLVHATQRFLNFEIGKKEGSNTNKVFCTAMGIHIGLSIIILLLFETFGLWFLNYKMNIPEGRMFAANVVYQCSALAFLINIISIPYTAVIVAYERMKAFAYISLFDAIMKLLIAYSLYIAKGDLLIVYSILLLCESLSIRLVYSIYCKRQFPSVSKFTLIRDKNEYKKQVGFAGYTFLGSIASILSNQGVNIIMNVFCGVTVNAARGIAVQVQHVTEKFVTDFMTALNPQITKTYAADEKEKSMELVYRGSKFSFFLVLIISIPILFKTSYVLDVWLKTYPSYAVSFTRLTICYTLITVLSKPIITEILATGEIKANAFIIGGIRLLILPLCYLVLYLGYEPTFCYYVLIIMDIIALNARLYIVRSITGTSILKYYRKVLFYVVPVSIALLIINQVGNHYFHNTVWGLIMYYFASLGVSVVLVFFLGLHHQERKTILAYVFNFLKLKK